MAQPQQRSSCSRCSEYQGLLLCIGAKTSTSTRNGCGVQPDQRPRVWLHYQSRRRKILRLKMRPGLAGSCSGHYVQFRKPKHHSLHPQVLSPELCMSATIRQLPSPHRTISGCIVLHAEPFSSNQPASAKQAVLFWLVSR